MQQQFNFHTFNFSIKKKMLIVKKLSLRIKTIHRKQFSFSNPIQTATAGDTGGAMEEELAYLAYGGPSPHPHGSKVSFLFIILDPFIT